MEYTGEHILIGQLGTAFVVIAFAAGILSLGAYFFASRRHDGSYTKFRNLGRTAFRIHSIAVLGIIGSLFYMILNGFYEYHYVWKHSSSDLPLRYVFSCFWEGQEGSFLLWSFWHVVLGNILIRTARNWEAPVMGVLSVVQVFLGSMLLGIYVFGHKIGSDPFILIRELPENIGLPWTKNPDYLVDLEQFQDGTGLNPLLQNYWMTIHPPTLFLGFAATLVPFAYAISGLVKRNLTGWMKPAIPWTFFGVGILGAGILMGGAWAYEALSFGGFWAWDPVENASLVPWITLVGAGHLMIINKRKATSVFTALLLTLLSFILVLYSTFLTRSGVLGDTSVHSFTSDGMLAHLLVYLLFFIGISVLLLLQKKKDRLLYGGISVLFLLLGVPLGKQELFIVLFLIISLVATGWAYKKHFAQDTSEEEKLWSREFWIFIGSLVLLLSAVQITFSTSKPVINLLLEPVAPLFSSIYDSTGWAFFNTLAQADLAPPSKVIHHYNSWQVPFAVIVSLLVAVGQFFRYKNTDLKQFARKIGVSFFISLILSLLLGAWLGFQWRNIPLIALLFTSTFATIANLDFLIRVIKGKFDRAGPSIAHIGFGLIMLGALISQSKSVKISQNNSGFDIKQISEDFKNDQDMLLFKGDTTRLGDHFVEFTGKRSEGIHVLYTLEFFEALPKEYEKGDLAVAQGDLFRARKDHKASDRFLKDMGKYWERVPSPSDEQLNNADPWTNKKPGANTFQLEPFIQKNERMGNVPEPDTRHTLSKDIYTHVRFAEIEARDTSGNEYMSPKEYTVERGDTIPASNSIIIFKGLQGVKDKKKENLLQNDIAAKAILEVTDENGETHMATPLYIIRDSSLHVPDVETLDDLGLKFRINKIMPQEGKVKIALSEKKSNSKEFIVLQAIVFPLINILWVGCILMVLGSFLAVRQRLKKKSGP